MNFLSWHVLKRETWVLHSDWQPFVKKHSFHLKIGCTVTIDLNCFKVQSKDSEFLALSHSR